MWWIIETIVVLISAIGIGYIGYTKGHNDGYDRGYDDMFEAWCRIEGIDVDDSHVCVWTRGRV